MKAKEYLMRYAPAAVALAFLAGVSSSVSYSAQRDDLSPRAAQLLAQGRAAMQAGKIDAAVDAYEAALVIEPGSTAVLISLAEAARRQDLQGKAIHYYRDALTIDPRNLAAIAGEGAALAEKGARNKAERNLAQLRSLCGDNCTEADQLAAELAAEPGQRVVSAASVKPAPVVSDN